MSGKKPDYEDWNRKPDLKGETPETPEAHRILVWLWIIGLVIFSVLVYALGKLTSYLQPAQHSGSFLILSLINMALPHGR